MRKTLYRDQHEVLKSSSIIRIIALLVIAIVVWSYHAKVSEVSNGTGKVIASSKEQVIQSLEGGVLRELNVAEGDIVDIGQVLALLDPERVSSNVEESKVRLNAALASVARLEAEVNQTALVFPDSITDQSVIESETALFNSRNEAWQQTLIGLEETKSLIEQELNITEPLVARGAASHVDVIRLKRQLSEITSKISDTYDQFIVKAQEELNKARADVDIQTQIVRGKNDALTRTSVISPVKGIIKNINIHTIGGVIPPNGEVMRIIPIDEKLLIETQISPRDIAYIHPGQEATIKITAYDYSIYGALKGIVETISPDTIQDEVKRDQYYYRVYIRTELDTLTTPNNQKLPITPGMVATVDIKTGEKTIFDYLIKPFNKAKEALRER
ncbi:membrane fusion protein, adhesin transport system [Thorsellia anophelis DSM 18579]|uniref:Membrane fusion protein (MFP) family protein n=2 Tax=Thorsellia anophelis TaxID=336804 RepID=A0A1I0DH64_9GAMM|nr:HlyD family type I secretion periplasmic adaptor subunit [Thorsellia anophelis]SET31545.1 membrane fusion protein, adhesin transport system [Thorsellia anophelis DSM 18579]